MAKKLKQRSTVKILAERAEKIYLNKLKNINSQLSFNNTDSKDKIIKHIKNSNITKNEDSNKISGELLTKTNKFLNISENKSKIAEIKDNVSRNNFTNKKLFQTQTNSFAKLEKFEDIEFHWKFNYNHKNSSLPPNIKLNDK